MSQLDRANTAPSLSFLQRRFTLNFLSRRESDSKKFIESAEQLRGPLGLNLLYEPSDPHLDLVFVHGLRGGSRKTWSYSTDLASYWPKEWLPGEPALKNTRIHSYGYNSDWGDRKASPLNIHDFAQALLADLQNSPHMRNNGHSPIILISHSMGGLVSKKAYLLAKRDPLYHDLAVRFHTMIFLGTPHRGAMSAQLLKSVLRAAVSHGPKAYITDLIPNSVTLQGINDEFRHVHEDLHLWSFFESVPTNLGVTNDLVVQKDSATMGLPKEHIQSLNADHRHVCKYSSPLDPNYLTVLNGLTATVDSIEKNGHLTKKDEYKSQMRQISKFLHTFDRPETDLESLLEHRLDGTCQWLTSNPTYEDWQHCKNDAPKFFWLSGQPGTGKSTLTAHVIEQLEQLEKRDSDCSYFFFKAGDETRSTIAALLRSLAYQMALVSNKIREEILAMIADGEEFDRDNDRTIWKSFFLTRIFRVEVQKPHFWVIDAIDECSNQSGLFSMISKMEKTFPLRVFLSSRPSASIDRMLDKEKIHVSRVETSSTEAKEDIRLLVDFHIKYLLDDDESRTQLAEQILNKSDGCLLWVAFILKELETTHGENQIQELLKGAPAGMDDLYMKILDNIAVDTKNKAIVKAVLRWVVCAIRPLTTDELSEALRLDIHENFPTLGKIVGSLCGNLVFVDTKKRVQVFHQTVRAFLSREDLESEFMLDKSKEQFRVAEVCLEHLAGKELQTSRIRRGHGTTRATTKRSPFTDYAAIHFSEHLNRSSSSVDSQLVLVENFLKANILTWIEIVARNGSMLPLTRTAKNLISYVERRAKYSSPLGKTFQDIDAWTNDLIRVVPEFGDNLLGSPMAIHFLIPPVCPPMSMLHRHFSNYPRCMKVAGVSETDWGDRLSSMMFPGTVANAVACRDGRLVIGLKNGLIMLYHATNCEEFGKLLHGEPVRQVKFATKSIFLISSGRRKLVLWNAILGTQIWQSQIKHEIMVLQFNEDDTVVRAATKENCITSWDMSDGKALPDVPFHDYDDLTSSKGYKRPPLTADISVGMNLLAVGYQYRPIGIWDLEDGSYIGQYNKGKPGVYPAPLLLSLLFNPNPEANLVAASYFNGDLVVFEPWEQRQVAVIQADAQILAASPDGRTLATGDGNGLLQLFDFETLQLIYRVTAYDHDIKAITFASNNLRFFDIQGDRCNVWEPSILVRRNHEEDGYSEPYVYHEKIQFPAEVSKATIWENSLTITALVEHDQGDFVFGGRENGSITVFDTKTGIAVSELPGHAKDVSIFLMSWNAEKSLLASTDDGGRFIVRRVKFLESGKWEADPPLLSERSSEGIAQILISPDGGRLLISTHYSDQCWGMDGSKINKIPRPRTEGSSWVNHPGNPKQIILMDGSHARIFEWDTFLELSPVVGIVLDTGHESKMVPSDIIPSLHGHNICVRFIGIGRPTMVSELQVWPSQSIAPNAKSLKSVARYKNIGNGIKAVVGSFKSFFIFLGFDGWICSLDIEGTSRKTAYIRHFIIPHGWHSMGPSPILRCTVQGNIILARGDEIVVFHKGLDFEEMVDLE